jgi:hypothetical protein
MQTGFLNQLSKHPYTESGISKQQHQAGKLLQLFKGNSLPWKLLHFSGRAGGERDLRHKLPAANGKGPFPIRESGPFENH